MWLMPTRSNITSLPAIKSFVCIEIIWNQRITVYLKFSNLIAFFGFSLQKISRFRSVFGVEKMNHQQVRVSFVVLLWLHLRWSPKFGSWKTSSSVELTFGARLGALPSCIFSHKLYDSLSHWKEDISQFRTSNVFPECLQWIATSHMPVRALYTSIF